MKAALRSRNAGHQNRWAAPVEGLPNSIKGAVMKRHIAFGLLALVTLGPVAALRPAPNIPLDAPETVHLAAARHLCRPAGVNQCSILISLGADFFALFEAPGVISGFENVTVVSDAV